MKNKIKYLIKYTFNKKIKTKWFKVVNILLLILLVAITNLNTIIKAFGGDFDKSNTIYVNSSKESYELFKTYYEAMSKSAGDTSNYEFKLTSDLNTTKKELKDTDDILVVINEDKVFEAELVSDETISTITYQLIYTSLDSARNDLIISKLDISNEDKLELSKGLVLERTYLSDIDEYGSAKETLGSILIPLIIVPFFMLIILLVQFIGADINEEKSTRGMEIIISSVPPKVHFFSKIIGTTLFVLMQAALFLVYGGIGLLVNKIIGASASSSISTTMSSILEVLKGFGVLEHLGIAIILVIILTLLSFLAYALFAGILASMTTSIEDYQQLQGPIMIVCVVGYYLAIMASVFEGSILIKIASYLPFISVMLSPILYILGQASLIDILISIVLTAGTVFLLFKYGLRVYKIGILNYSSKDLWKKVFKSIRTKEV